MLNSTNAHKYILVTAKNIDHYNRNRSKYICSYFNLDKYIFKLVTILSQKLCKFYNEFRENELFWKPDNYNFFLKKITIQILCMIILPPRYQLVFYGKCFRRLRKDWHWLNLRKNSFGYFSSDLTMIGFRKCKTQNTGIMHQYAVCHKDFKY